MSSRATSWAWGQDVPAIPKLVLLSLADHADREANSCFPSRKTIAAECGIGASTVTKAIHLLEEKGLLERVERHRENGSRTSNEYSLKVGTPCSDVAGPPAPTEQAPCSERAPHNQLSEPITPSSPPDEVEIVFEHWRRVMAHPQAILDDSRRRVIEKALKIATADECKRAISGCSRSDFHMARGKYKGQRRQEHLSLILRNRENVERFMEGVPETADSSSADGFTSSARDAKIKEHKRNVLRAFDLAGSAEARESGDESERWLAQHGIRVVRESGERPTFSSPVEPGR